MTNRMELLYQKKLQLDRTENPTNDQQCHFNTELLHFFKYINSFRDLFDNKFLVFISNLPMHWTVIIIVNPFLVFDWYVFGDKYINKHDDDFAGWCVIDSLGGGSTAVPHEYLTGTSWNHFHPELGVCLFLNYCTSFLKGEYSKTTYFAKPKVKYFDESGKEEKEWPSRPEFYVQYKEPFGDYKENNGTASFPWFDFSSPAFLNQRNSNDCGLASVANSLAFVLALQKLSFKCGVNYTTPTIMGESNRFTLDLDRYTTASFGRN